MEIIKLSQRAVNEAVNCIKNGEVVIFPTDTVYGFLADASNRKAVDKIYKIKKRPRSKPLAVFVRDLKMAKQLAEISKEQEKILKKYWFTRRSLGEGGPGAYTFVLKSKIKNPLITKNKTIALRIPKYKFLQNLLKKINKPLAQTSVNISGKPTLQKSEDIIKEFGKLNILFIDAGNLKNTKPSKIIDLTEKNKKVLRG